MYTDWKNVYVREAAVKEKLSGQEPETQFGRICKELGIRIIAAHTPQAKGRVERAHGTHQDRLVKKMRLMKIASYEQANRYLEEEYIDDHTQRFSHPAASLADFHGKPLSKQALALFCMKEERVVSNDWTISYHRRLLQLDK